MYVSKIQYQLAIALFAALFSAPLVALDFDQLDWTQTREEWGQVMFCQYIYKMPEVKPRLYSFDVEACDKAGQLLLDVVAKYTAQEQVQLKNQAEQHAIKLSYNTSEPYHSVSACREYCSELARIQDKVRPGTGREGAPGYERND